MSLNSLLRLLLPKADHFYGFLEKQAELAHAGALALAEANTPGADLAAIRDRIQELEHQGDQEVHKMLDALSATFVTPIDREDLQRLSKRIDDILDYTNAASRACVLFAVEEPTAAMRQLITTLADGTRMVNEAVPKLRVHAYPEAIRICAQVTMSEKNGDAVYRDALNKLFHDPAVDAKTILREREVLDDLEKAINRCEQTADIVTTIAVKHS